MSLAKIMTAVVFSAATTFAVAQVSETQAANNLIKLLDQTQSMSASFTQTTKTPTPQVTLNEGKVPMFISKAQPMSGQMWVKRPNLFRWETKKPAEQLIVAQKDQLYIYDPDLMQVTVQSIDEQVAQTPALLLSGDASSILKNYNVSASSRVKQGFILKPKSQNASFEAMGVVFANSKLKSMVLKDALGQITTIKFDNIKANQAISPALFAFKPPADADIIYQ